MPRQIFRFRSVGLRRLSHEEIEWLRQQVRRRAARSGLHGLANILLILAALGGLLAVWHESPLFWILVVGAIWLLAVSWGKANESEGLARLFRRAVRLGEVEQFERGPITHEVRKVWEKRFKPSPDEEGEDLGGESYWEAEEKLEETLEKATGHPADRFECVAEDGVLLYVEGKPVTGVLTLPVLDV